MGGVFFEQRLQHGPRVGTVAVEQILPLGAETLGALAPCAKRRIPGQVAQ